MDVKLPYYRLTQQQQLNVECDNGAKKLAITQPDPAAPHNIKTKAWSLWIDDKRVTRDFNKEI